MSLNLRGTEGATDAGQEASVAFGVLSSSQSLSAGQGISASQSTAMEGQRGRVVSGALGETNMMLAEGSFSGQSSLAASLTSRANERAFSSGSVALDDMVILDDGSFAAVSAESKNRIMGMAGMKLLEDGKGVGSFGMSAMNIDLNEEKGASAAQISRTAAAAPGGSYSSYALTGFRWNQKDPKVQLYLNPTDTPSGLTAASTQSAIAAAANTWDDAVAQNIFADGTTVIIDSTKVVDNPFPSSGQEVSDGYSVNGWKNLGNSYLGLNRWWSNGQKVNGYYSLTETDTWYNLNYAWTTDLATAQSTNKIDLQSVATHELGHGIGMDDIYSTEYGGTLPPSDPRTQDFQQVMNVYDGPQRTLGNGDKTGVQQLYGSIYEKFLKGDFDGDGKADLIQFNGNDYVNLKISNGDGTFGLQTFSPWSGYGTSLGKWELGDFNGDGKTDLQHIWGGDYINTWISKGDGTFEVKSFCPWAGYGASLGDWATADVNGDGKADLQHIWGGDYINTWISKGDGTYQMRSFQPWAGYGTSLGDWATADVNGDGKADLQHIWGGDYINTWISKGDGTYQMKSYSPSPGYSTTKGEWIALDINGDKKGDLAYIVGADHVDSWLSKGDGTYKIKTYSPWSGYDTTAGKWREGDVNGDGKSDLMHLNGGDSMFIWLSNGDGTFSVVT
jgi:hypothetical protein